MSVCSRCSHEDTDHPYLFLCKRCRCGGWVKAAAGTKEPTWKCVALSQKKCSPNKTYSTHLDCGYLVG